MRFRAVTAVATLVGATLVGIFSTAADALPPNQAPVESGWAIDATGRITTLTSPTAPTPPAPVGAPDWGGWRIARGIAAARGIGSVSTWGLVLDGFGGLHPVGFGAPVTNHRVTSGPYWNGWDIARGVALLPNGSGGVVVDGWGGLHGFGVEGQPAPTIQGGPYWPGWDIARSVALSPDASGGWVVDGYGGLHPFGLNGNPAPTLAVHAPYWDGIDYVRGFHVTADAQGAYFLGRWGLTYAFPVGTATKPRPPASSVYAPTQDLMRGMTFWRYSHCDASTRDILNAGC
jgi:hypothetical protein